MKKQPTKKMISKQILQEAMFNLHVGEEDYVCDPYARQGQIAKVFIDCHNNRKNRLFCYTPNGQNSKDYLVMDLDHRYIQVAKDVVHEVNENQHPIWRPFGGFDAAISYLPESLEAIDFIYHTYYYYVKTGGQMVFILSKDIYYSDDDKVISMRKDLNNNESFEIINKDDYVIIKFKKTTVTQRSDEFESLDDMEIVILEE
jgi:hypothetical protein